jgi:23S rRNA (uracil1939-C5)-methyltransferase
MQVTMDIKVEKLVYGGEGLARHEGQTIFVPFVLPDERARVRVTERKKKFLRARVEEMLEPSPARAAARCPHFTRCGGCHYQHIPYEQQLAYKEEILRETLRRLGRIEWTGGVARHASPEYGYRNRAQWKVRRQNGRVVVGYHQAGSGAIEPAGECPILAPRLERTLAALAALVADGTLDDTLREVEAFTDGAGERLLVNAAFARFEPSADELAEVLRAALGAPDSLLLHDAARDRFELYGPGWIEYATAEANYRVGHLSFFQVNRHLIEPLATAVTGEAAGRLAVDLFAGVGLFSVLLARGFERVVAVEANPAAVRDLEENLKPVPHARAVASEAGAFLATLEETPELVVLDPPRTGLDAVVLEHLVRLAPPRIVYLSCDPATLARDLAALGERSGGAWAIAAIEMFDVFPQSFHIETLVRLERAR